MKLSPIFKVSAAALVVGSAGYGGYVAADSGYQYLAKTPMPAMSGEARERAKHYSLRFTTVLAEQQILDNTTDEEEAGHKLFEDKRELATDAMLDRNLSEADLARLARDFNAISTDDAIRFRSYNFAPETMARRNECLHVTPATNEQHGADRFAYAQRVETCMINMTEQAPATNVIAARMGGAAGGGMAFAFLLGFSARRRVHGAKAPKA